MEQFDKRLTELETLVWEVPTMLNLRFAKLEAGFQDTSGRLSALERTLSMVQVDMRDLRGGVTRQLIEQDKRLVAIEAEVKGLRADVDVLKQGMAKSDKAIDKAIGKFNEAIADIKKSFGESHGSLNAKLVEMLVLLKR